MGAVWVKNSLRFDHPPTDQDEQHLLNLIYAVLAISSAILFHSMLLYGPKYNPIRGFTDASAAAALVSAALLFDLFKSDYEPQKVAYCLDLVFNGICVPIMQVCDNYMFYTRLSIATEIPRPLKVFINLYIWVIMTIPCYFSFIITPFFRDTNSPEYLPVIYITGSISVWANIAYNAYFTYMFAAILIRTESTISDVASYEHKRTIRMLLYKNLGHCITSSMGSAFYICVPGLFGALVQTLVFIVGLHMWFNAKRSSPFMDDIIGDILSFYYAFESNYESQSLPGLNRVASTRSRRHQSRTRPRQSDANRIQNPSNVPQAAASVKQSRIQPILGVYHNSSSMSATAADMLRIGPTESPQKTPVP
jgi:hypothetical protein